MALRFILLLLLAAAGVPYHKVYAAGDFVWVKSAVEKEGTRGGFELGKRDLFKGGKAETRPRSVTTNRAHAPSRAMDGAVGHCKCPVRRGAWGAWGPHAQLGAHDEMPRTAFRRQTPTGSAVTRAPSRETLSKFIRLYRGQILLAVVLAGLLFIYVGFRLSSYASITYGFKVFSLGRLFFATVGLAIPFFIFMAVALTAGDGERPSKLDILTIVLSPFAVIIPLMLSNMRRTNLLVGLVATIYQAAASFLFLFFIFLLLSGGKAQGTGCHAGHH